MSGAILDFNIVFLFQILQDNIKPLNGVNSPLLANKHEIIQTGWLNFVVAVSNMLF